METFKTPTLILQGARDSFGSRDAVAAYKLSPDVQMHWLKAGGHSLKPRKKSGRTEQQNWEEAIDELTAFVGSLVSLRS